MASAVFIFILKMAWFLKSVLLQMSGVWSVSETPHLKLQCGGNRAKDSGMHLKKMSCERTDVKETTEDPLVSEVT